MTGVRAIHTVGDRIRVVRHPIGRVLFDCVVLACAFVAPWAVAVVGGLVGIVALSAYELIAVGLILDTFFSPLTLAGTQLWWGFTALMLIASGATLFVRSLAREYYSV